MWATRQILQRENFICKAGTPEGQPLIYAGAYVTVHNNAHIEKQEAQLMLTTGSTRLAVSQGQQTWYHSTCYI